MSDRQPLPQLSGSLLLADGGIETDLIFRQGWELPSFAAFVLLDDRAGKEALRKYFRLPFGALSARESAANSGPTASTNL